MCVCSDKKKGKKECGKIDGVNVRKGEKKAKEGM